MLLARQESPGIVINSYECNQRDNWWLEDKHRKALSKAFFFKSLNFLIGMAEAKRPSSVMKRVPWVRLDLLTGC
jgi:hypothetical protein